MHYKKLSSLLLTAALATTLSAQSFLVSYSESPAVNDLRAVEMNYNAATGNPELLGQRQNGFTMLTMSPYTGSMSINYTVTYSTAITTAATIKAGTNDIVASYETNTILISSVPTYGGSVNYTKLIPRFILNITNITPVDLAYDGSTYVYMLCSGTVTGSSTFVTIKINAATGAVSNYYWMTPATSENFVPTDLEFLNSNNIYVSGVYTSALGAKSFFVGKLNNVNPFIYTGTKFTLTNAAGQPTKCYVKAIATSPYPTVYLVGLVRGTTKSAPIEVIKTINTGATYTISYARQMQTGVTDLTAVDLQNDKLVIAGPAGSLYAETMLYDCTTDLPVNDYGMSSSLIGGNVIPRSVYLPQLNRIYTSCCDAAGKTLYSFRSHPNTAYTACATNIPWTEAQPTVTPLTLTPPSTYTLPNTSNFGSTITFNSYFLNSICEVSRLAQPENESPEQVSTLLYPNPASDHFTISSERGAVASVRILDMSGRLVSEIQNTGADDLEVSVSGFENGVYFILMSFVDGHTEQEKIIVQK